MTLNVSRREQEEEEEEKEEVSFVLFTGKLQHSADCCDCLVPFILVKWHLLIIKVSHFVC